MASSIERRTILADPAQSALDLGDQIGPVGGTGHGSTGWMTSSTGSQTSG